jgi:hypothetical protein
MYTMKTPLSFPGIFNGRIAKGQSTPRCRLHASLLPGARVLLCIVLAQGLTGCDHNESPVPLPAAAALPPPPPPAPPSAPPHTVEAWHGFFEGTIAIGDEQRNSDALLTADGAVRMNVANPGAIWDSAGSAQFVGTFEKSGDQGSGSGVIIGQGCAGSSPGRFCSAPALAEISITLATRARLSGEIRVSTDAGEPPSFTRSFFGRDSISFPSGPPIRAALNLAFSYLQRVHK